MGAQPEALTIAARRETDDGSPVSLLAPHLRGNPCADISKTREGVGEELLPNGDFSDGSTGWSFPVSWSVSAGQAHLDGTQEANADLVYASVLEVGKTYLLELDVVDIQAGEFKIWNGVTYTFDGGTVGHKRILFEAASTTAFCVYGDSVTTGTIDNISVREVPAANGNDGTAYGVEFDPQRGAVFDGAGDISIQCETVIPIDRSYHVSFTKTQSQFTSSRVCEESNGKFIIYITSDASGVGVGVNGLTNYHQFGNILTAGKRERITVSLRYDTGNMYGTVYVDGVATAEELLGTPFEGESPLYIGNRTDGSRPLEGDIMYFVIREGEATPEQIAADIAGNIGSEGLLIHDYRRNAPLMLQPNGPQSLTLNGCTPQPDGSLLFDGAGQYASCDDVIPIDESYTVHAWVKPENGGGNGSGRVCDNGKVIVAPRYDRLISTSVDGVTNVFSAADAITFGVYQLLSVSLRMDVDGHCYVTFYINGVQSGDEQDAGVPVAGTTDLYIGNRAAGDRTFDGSLIVGIERGEATVESIIRWADLHCPSGVEPSWALGPELLTNGDFSDGSTGWTLNAGWSIYGGLAVAVETSGSIYQSIASHVTGNIYRVACDIVEIPIAGFRPILGGSSGVANDSIGQSIDILSTVLSDKNIYLDAGVSAGSVSVSNVSVRRLLSPLAAAVASLS
jgi:hypothetical protein